MTTRASRVLPGVLVSMLLAGSLMAAPSNASAADAPDRKNISQEHRRPSAHPRGAKTTQKAAKSPGKTSLAANRRRPATTSTAAFIDDGFRYSQDGDGHMQWKQTGVASWYGGPRWQGHRTSSGARYDENALTAAHATLPLGSRVRVTLANSERTVIVTITDRPGTRTRIIDLSRGAAAALGILSRGIAVVTLSPG